MENEAAPTGGRLASPEVIGGKSNRHSGEKGAPQAPFFHAFFGWWRAGKHAGSRRAAFCGAAGAWVAAAAGMLRAEGRCVGALEGRGAAGVLFSCPFLGGGCGRKGCCGAFWAKGRCGGGVCCGGRGEGMAFGRAEGGAAAFARRFLLFGGWSHRFWGRPFFLGEGIVRGKLCREPPRRQKRRGAFGFFPAAAPVRARRREGGMKRRSGGSAAAGRERGKGEKRERGDGGAGRGSGEEGKRKKRSAILPNASYRGSFVSRRGRWNKCSICGSSHNFYKCRANIVPPLRGRRGLLLKAYSSPCAIRSGFQTSRS